LTSSALKKLLLPILIAFIADIGYMLKNIELYVRIVSCCAIYNLFRSCSSDIYVIYWYNTV
jgi:hypothetical protein